MKQFLDLLETRAGRWNNEMNDMAGLTNEITPLRPLPRHLLNLSYRSIGIVAQLQKKTSYTSS